MELALTGQSRSADPEAGLAYLGDGRWHVPAQGRLLQPNPVGGPGVAEGATSGLSPFVRSVIKEWRVNNFPKSKCELLKSPKKLDRYFYLC